MGSGKRNVGNRILALMVTLLVYLCSILLSKNFDVLIFLAFLFVFVFTVQLVWLCLQLKQRKNHDNSGSEKHRSKLRTDESPE